MVGAQQQGGTSRWQQTCRLASNGMCHQKLALNLMIFKLSWFTSSCEIPWCPERLQRPVLQLTWKVQGCRVIANLCASAGKEYRVPMFKHSSCFDYDLQHCMSGAVAPLARIESV